jgi:hypothetical protein
MAKDKYPFPFGVYDIKRCCLLYIGLHEDEADVWRIWTGWGDGHEIAYEKEQGYRVIPITIQYDPPKE